MTTSVDLKENVAKDKMEMTALKLYRAEGSTELDNHSHSGSS